jgi:hypothetical protein
MTGCGFCAVLSRTCSVSHFDKLGKRSGEVSSHNNYTVYCPFSNLVLEYASSADQAILPYSNTINEFDLLSTSVNVKNTSNFYDCVAPSKILTYMSPSYNPDSNSRILHPL